MNIYDWATFLAQWNTELLNDDEFTDSLPEEIKSSGWLGCPGATTKQIEMLEMRLGVKLPPSYHAFLSTSNGWKMTPFVRRIWSTEQVAWFHVRNQAWIDSYLASSAKSTSLPNAVSVTYDHQQTSTTIYIDHVQYTLEVSDKGDRAIYLLNPKVVADSGEWEAWFFADWLPSPKRYPSFWDLMEGEYAERCV